MYYRFDGTFDIITEMVLHGDTAYCDLRGTRLRGLVGEQVGRQTII